RTAVSRLLIDCRGRRTSGVVSSNGAASVSRATPAKSVKVPMGSRPGCRKKVPRSLPRARHRCSQGTPAAYARNAIPQTPTKAGGFRVDERSFRNPKLRPAFLITYKAAADLAAKGSLFVVTVVAARRLSAQAFGVFSLGSTLGWMAAVASDFGIQLHVARA